MDRMPEEFPSKRRAGRLLRRENYVELDAQLETSKLAFYSKLSLKSKQPKP